MVNILINNSTFHHHFINGHGGRYVNLNYLPLQITPLFDFPRLSINYCNEFRPLSGITSRYATRLINNRFYGVVTVGHRFVTNENDGSLQDPN